MYGLLTIECMEQEKNARNPIFDGLITPLNDALLRHVENNSIGDNMIIRR